MEMNSAYKMWIYSALLSSFVFICPFKQSKDSSEKSELGIKHAITNLLGDTSDRNYWLHGDSFLCKAFKRLMRQMFKPALILSNFFYVNIQQWYFSFLSVNTTVEGTVSWNMMLCSLVDGYCCPGATYCPHLQCTLKTETAENKSSYWKY